MFFSEPTFGTFFYERNFIRLVLIVGIIAAVAVGLFLWERTRKEDRNKDEEKEPEKRVRAPRSMDFSRK